MADKKESTLRCVGTLAIIAVVCALLLSVLSSLLYVAPSAADIEKAAASYNALSGYSWTVTEMKDGKYGEGGRVTLVAEGTCEGKDTYVGMLIQTDKSGKLNESTYAMFFNKTTNTLEYATYASMGSTGGFDWAYAKAHAGGGDDASTGATALTALLTDDTSSVGAEWRDWESFYVEITSETVNNHTDAVPAKTGATRTVTATYNAFNIAARYYYDNYVKGVNAQ